MTDDEKERDRIGEQFTESAHRTDHLLHQLYDMDMESGAVLSGALTTVLHHLLELAPDVPSAIGVLSSCMRNANIQNKLKADIFEVEYEPEEPDGKRKVH